MSHWSPIIVVAAVALLAGCGPLTTGVQILHAQSAIQAAEAAGAATRAPYEYTVATQYLAKAREENAYAIYWAAEVFAVKALRFATAAQTKAREPIAASAPPAVAVPPAKPAVAVPPAAPPTVGSHPARPPVPPGPAPLPTVPSTPAHAP